MTSTPSTAQDDFLRWTRAVAARQPCPFCGVPAGQPCVTKGTGEPHGSCHTARLELDDASAAMSDTTTTVDHQLQRLLTLSRYLTISSVVAPSVPKRAAELALTGLAELAADLDSQLRELAHTLHQLGITSQEGTP